MSRQHCSLLTMLAPLLLSYLTLGTGITTADDAATPDHRPTVSTPTLALTPFYALYSVSHLGIPVANAELSLEAISDQQYLYRSVTTPVGVSSWFFSEKRSEQTLFEFKAGKLKPLNYRYQLEGGSHPREVRVDFDWTRLRATNTAANHSWRMAIPDNAVDKLSVQLALTLALQAQSEPALSQVYEYPVADGGHLKTYRFENHGYASVETPVGHYRALRLVGRQQYPGNRLTELWLAPSLGYLPIRIDQAQGGMGSALMHLEKIEFFPVTPDP